MLQRPSLAASLPLVLVALGVAVASSTASAQVTVRAVALDTINCSPNSGSPIASGTDISAGYAISGSTFTDCGLGLSLSRSAASTFSTSRQGNVITVTLQQSANASGNAWGCSGSASAGAARIQVTLSSPTAVTGSLIARAEGTSLFANDPALGVLELTGPGSPTTLAQFDTHGFLGTSERPITVGPAGVMIEFGGRVDSSAGFLSTRPPQDQSLVLQFVEGAFARLEPSGDPCGPELSTHLDILLRNGSPTPVLHFDVAHSPQWPGAQFVLGISDPSVPIPPTNCLLRTDILIALPTGVDNSGAASWIQEIPPSVYGARFRVQYLVGRVAPAGFQEWQTSQAYQIWLR